MYDKAFENECDDIITNLDTRNMVSANTFITLATKATKKYPVLFLPAFIEDFVRGMPSSKLIQKYELQNFNNLSSFVTSLRMKSRQFKDSNLGVKDKNLQNSEQYERYRFLSKFANMFYDPLENLLNYNILQGLVSYTIFKYEYVTEEHMQNYIMNTHDIMSKEIAILSDKDRMDSFEKYLRYDLRLKINDIVSSLHEQRLVGVYEGDVSIPSEYQKFRDHIHDILKNEKNGIRYGTLHRKILNKFPLFQLMVSSILIFENTLESLELKNQLIRKKAFWKYSPSYDHLFTTENYQTMMSYLTQQVIESGRTKFFGRRINPKLFLDELELLEYGDLGDEDDQVTRIAGLVLSDIVMLQSPRENMREFDFVMDLKNYSFRPEQKAIMKKLNFKVRSSIFHCKIMINTEVTPFILSKLASVLPLGEQGVIFTCKPVSPDVSEIITDDKTIQIMDRDAIYDWCKITPTIPCRKNSVARVRYGDNMCKVVLIKSLNYESGLATVETVSDGQEILIPIGSIEEMLHNVSSLDDFDIVTENYLSFLRLLADVSQDSFERGLNTNIIAIYDNQMDFLKNTNPELFDRDSGAFFGSKLASDNSPMSGKKYVRFENVNAEIIISSRLHYSKCECSHLLNEDRYQTLCPHLVAGLDHLCKESGDAKTILKNTDRLKTALTGFMLDNMKRSIEALSFALGSERQILKSYIEMHVNSP